MKILTVDDELVSRNKMQKILSGFSECGAVTSGQEATTAFKDALDNDEVDLPNLESAWLFEIGNDEFNPICERVDGLVRVSAVAF